MSVEKSAELSEGAISRLADELWVRLVGANCDPIEVNLRAKLALEQRIVNAAVPAFGLDRLATEEAAAYIGLKAETLRERRKRQALQIPPPYRYGRKLFWRRTELDVWIENHREEV